jgi:hypothetical protein
MSVRNYSSPDSLDFVDSHLLTETGRAWSANVPIAGVPPPVIIMKASFSVSTSTSRQAPAHEESYNGSGRSIIEARELKTDAAG